MPGGDDPEETVDQGALDPLEEPVEERPAEAREEVEDDELDDVDEPRESEAPPPYERDDRQEEPRGRRRRLERLLPDVIKRAIERGIETGLGTLTNASGHARTVAQKTNEAAQGLPKELSSVPKELAGFVFSQVDETKNAMVRVVAREVREFLEAADIAKELHRALTSLSFEIKTEIRFIPNDAGGVKPDVRAAVSPKRARRTNRRPTAVADEEDDGDGDDR